MRRVLLLFALLLTACTAQDVPGQLDQPPARPQGRLEDGAPLPTGGVAEGAADAPLTLILVTHPACIYCQDLHQDLLPRLRAQFTEPRLLRLETVILPLRKYPESALLRRSLACAEREGRAGALLDRLFQDRLTDTGALLAAYAETGSGTQAFATCLSQPPSLATEDALLKNLRVTLVPTFILRDPQGRELDRLTGLPKWADLRGWLMRILPVQP